MYSTYSYIRRSGSIGLHRVAMAGSLCDFLANYHTILYFTLYSQKYFKKTMTKRTRRKEEEIIDDVAFVDSMPSSSALLHRP